MYFFQIIRNANRNGSFKQKPLVSDIDEREVRMHPNTDYQLTIFTEKYMVFKDSIDVSKTRNMKTYYYIHGSRGELPIWFVTKFQQGLELNAFYENKEKTLLSNMFKRKPSFEEFTWQSRYIHKRVESERGISLCELYLRTLDNFENSSWPTDLIFYRQESLYDCIGVIRILHENLRYLNVSNKLADSLVRDSKYIYNIYSVEKMVQMNLIRNNNSANYLCEEIFEHLFYGFPGYLVSFRILCDWINKGWVDLIKYDKYIEKFICDKDFRNLEDRMCLLKLLQKYPAFYNRMAIIFDATIKIFNIERFVSFIKNRDNNPYDFVAYPFSDGSRMKPVRKWFSWNLE